VSPALIEGRKLLAAHKHVLEKCCLTDNLRDIEDNLCGPSNLRLNVQKEMLNKVLQNTIASLDDSRFFTPACTLFAKIDIVATQHVLEVSLRKLLFTRHLSWWSMNMYSFTLKSTCQQLKVPLLALSSHRKTCAGIHSM
jgi:hypothetical protein